jgi:hypothetical protein
VCAANRASSSRLTFSNCRTLPQVNERRNDPNVDGARTPVNTLSMLPCRNTSRSSMLSAPASIPATIPGTFTGAFTPSRSPIATDPATRSSKPHRSASRIAGSSPP